jgi:chemotaxis protein MotB
MVYLLTQADLPEKAQEFVTANGRSYSRMVLTNDGMPDKERSRRIEIRFRLKDEDAIRRIMERLSAK